MVVPLTHINIPILDDSRLTQEFKRVYGCAYEVALKSLMLPPRRYYIRVNTLKTDPNQLINELRDYGLEVYVDEYIDEALWFPVKGPLRLEELECKVYVDKYTAESVMLGANVYAPGIVSVDECAKEGVPVSIVYRDIIVANGIVVADPRELLRRGKGLVVRVYKSLFKAPSVKDLNAYSQGLIYDQSYPSIVVGRLVDPKPGELIVDMCAAPGGKTGHIYELCKGECKIIAIDHSKRRIERMMTEFKRLGYRDENIIVRVGDSRYLDLKEPSLIGKVDKVIIDPPCSALGVVPKIHVDKNLEDIENLSRYQKQFIKPAYKLLKCGGQLIYSTCTITLRENEEVIKWALENYKLELIDVYPRYKGSSGITFKEALRYHHHVQGLGGFFIAKMMKVC